MSDHKTSEVGRVGLGPEPGKTTTATGEQLARTPKKRFQPSAAGKLLRGSCGRHDLGELLANEFCHEGSFGRKPTIERAHSDAGDPRYLFDARGKTDTEP